MRDQSKSREDNHLIAYWRQTGKISTQGDCLNKYEGDRQEMKQVTAFREEMREVKYVSKFGTPNITRLLSLHPGVSS